MKTSATRKIRTLMRKARAIPGKESRKTWGSRNACLTSGHPDAFTITATRTPTMTIVLSVATAIARPPPGDPEPMMRERLSPVRALPQVRSSGLGEVRPLEPLDGPVRPQPVQRAVHALHERIALLEDHAEVLTRPALREPADDRPVVELHGRDVEGRGQVDHDAVDLAGLQCRDRVVVRVVDGRALRGPDEVLDVVVAGRADLRAELVRPQSRHGPDSRDRRAGIPDGRLVHEVVRVRKRDVLRARGEERDLRHVEVERLRPRSERVVEGNRTPRDLSLREPELLRDRVRDRGLVALAA